MTEEKLVFPAFDDIQASTKTIIVKTNVVFNLDKLYSFLPITPYISVPKRRGRKKKNNTVDPNRNIPDGSIITLELKGDVKGVILRKKKKKEGKAIQYFRNSLTVIMFIDKKRINFKISRNGKFQLTGCKFDEHAEKCIKYMWEYIRDNRELYRLEEKFITSEEEVKTIEEDREIDDEVTEFTALFIPAMRNIDFSLGFTLNRERLNEFMNTQDEYCSLLDTNIGYTGVNIKTKVKKSIKDLMVKQLTYKMFYDGDKIIGDWQEPVMVKHEEYLNTLKPKEKQKKLDKGRYNTFLVFHSGKCIMSSMCEEFARESYDHFLNTVRENYKEFREEVY